ncbi:MAG: hypothetical protein LBP64_00790 [Tannerella sp.]|nr:hypothetical protein [Tannerella sp.]
MENSVNERIKSMIKELGYKSKRAFAHKIGLSQTSFNDVVNGAEPKHSTLYKILKAEPSVNPGWLLTGEGEMLRVNNLNDVRGNGNTSVAGDGNQINAFNLSEMIELQKNCQERLKDSQQHLSEIMSQNSKLLAIIEQLNKKQL